MKRQCGEFVCPHTESAVFEKPSQTGLITVSNSASTEEQVSSKTLRAVHFLMRKLSRVSCDSSLLNSRTLTLEISAM